MFTALISQEKKEEAWKLANGLLNLAIFSILAIRDNLAPPTINLDNVDEGCHLNYVPHQAQAKKIDVALSNSFGFGGTNGTLIFKRV